MKKYLLFAAAVAALLTSCQKENGFDDSSAKGVKTITASIGNSTKVVMGEDKDGVTKLNWEEGDKLLLINIHLGESPVFSSSKYSANNSGETATFDFVAGTGTAISPDDMHYAYYPYEKMQFNTLQSGNPEFRFNYSDSQTYTENSFDKNVMPLFALNTGGTNFTLDAMAPVLRLNVKLASEDSDVKVNSLVIESTENKLSGISILDDGGFYEPEENTGKSITLDCGEGVAINNTDATQFCIVLPPNTYDEGDLKITIKTNKGNIVKTSKAAATFVAGKVYNINVSGEPALPAGALSGVFTVGNGTDNIAGTSDDVKVYFSKGNLQAKYNGTKYIWGFAANQYDCIGDAAGNTTITADGTNDDNAIVDLFGWSTNEKYGINISTQQDDYLGSFKDWGEKIGGGNTWRTLSKDEWVYLFNTRSASTVNGVTNARYAKATVNSKAGMILLPDSYTHPSGVANLLNINSSSSAFTGNSYNTDQWAKLESAGAVFLPAAGGRSGSVVSYSGSSGIYWSSTVSTNYVAHDVDFNSTSVNPGSEDIHQYGCSVRLITDVN